MVDDPAIASAEHAFSRGDHAEVRRICASLRDRPDEVGSAARALLARTGVDRMQVLALGVSLLFFLLIVYKYVL